LPLIPDAQNREVTGTERCAFDGKAALFVLREPADQHGIPPKSPGNFDPPPSLALALVATRPEMWQTKATLGIRECRIKAKAGKTRVLPKDEEEWADENRTHVS
jgi:hypothetical protein